MCIPYLAKVSRRFVVKDLITRYAVMVVKAKSSLSQREEPETEVSLNMCNHKLLRNGRLLLRSQTTNSNMYDQNLEDEEF